jgi:hypothetical protein
MSVKGVIDQSFTFGSVINQKKEFTVKPRLKVAAVPWHILASATLGVVAIIGAVWYYRKQTASKSI